MKILLTGGTGVIGEGIVPQLIDNGHEIRLLSRGADEAAREWPHGVEPYAADVSKPATLEGAADGCDVVVHVTGIVEEDPPEITYQRINVDGTRNIIAEAERAGVARFIYVSSLGVERGQSEYHNSKRQAEEIVRQFNGQWMILRPGNVYGPGDEVISKLLKMVRALPVMPVIDTGNQPFQPIWYQDLGAAIARAVDSREHDGSVFELTGGATTTTNDLLDKLAAITDRNPIRLPIPSFVASIGASVAETMGVPLPINQSKIDMLIEGNVIDPPEKNALTRVFGISPTPLDKALRTLADAVPEQTPLDGFGGLERKSFWADIVGTGFTADDLMRIFRDHCTEIMPIEFDAEPGTPHEIRKGVTLTAALPLRGNIQMRVQEASNQLVTFATLEGHPLAGVVQFRTEPAEGGARFSVTIHARAASFFDWLAMNTVGGPMQAANWETVVTRMVELSNGKAPNGVQHKTEKLGENEADEVDEWIRELIVQRRRQENAGVGN